MMFINKKDALRTANGIERKPIDKIITDRVFYVPLSAIGETFHKIGEKEDDPEYRIEIYEEMQRLMTKNFLNIAHIRSGIDVFSNAKTIMEKNNGDDRDCISPMDALILAVAISDCECKSFYTTDQKLLFNYELKEFIKAERCARGLEDITIGDLPLKNKSKKCKGWN